MFHVHDDTNQNYSSTHHPRQTPQQASWKKNQKKTEEFFFLTQIHHVSEEWNFWPLKDCEQ